MPTEELDDLVKLEDKLRACMSMSKELMVMESPGASTAAEARRLVEGARRRCVLLGLEPRP